MHGFYAERWRAADELELGVERLPTVPLEIDGWKAEERESDAGRVREAGARGYWTRTYRKDGHEILAILMVGRAGRMSVHTPEVCYRGAGYELLGPADAARCQGWRRQAGRVLDGDVREAEHAGSESAALLGLERRRRLEGADVAALGIRGSAGALQAVSVAGPDRADRRRARMDDFLRKFLPAIDAAVSRSERDDSSSEPEASKARTSQRHRPEPWTAFASVRCPLPQAAEDRFDADVAQQIHAGAGSRSARLRRLRDRQTAPRLFDRPDSPRPDVAADADRDGCW